MRAFSSGGLCLEEIKETKSYCGFKLFEFIQIQVRSLNPFVAYWVVMAVYFSKKKKKIAETCAAKKKCLWVNDAVGRSMVYKRWGGVLFSCNQVFKQQVMAVLSASQSQRFSRTNRNNCKVLFHILIKYW